LTPETQKITNPRILGQGTSKLEIFLLLSILVVKFMTEILIRLELGLN